MEAVQQLLTREECLRIISSKAKNTIQNPGSYKLKTTNDTHGLEAKANPLVSYEIKEGFSQLTIANFNAITPFQLNEALALVKEGKFDEAANKGLSLGITNKSYYPTKGERVNVYVDNVELKSGESALFAVEVNEMPTEKAKSFSVADLEAMLAAPVKGAEAPELATADNSAIVDAMSK